MMFMKHVALLVCAVSCYESEGSGGAVAVGRRRVVPMHDLAKRRHLVDGRYRRSKDIRTDVYDRRIEEAQWKEIKAADEKERLERLHRELRWLTINSNELAIY